MTHTDSHSARAQGLRQEFVSVALVFTVALWSCGGDGGDELTKAAASLGLADAPPLPAEVIDLGCDVSLETPCTTTTIATTLEKVLPYAAVRPNSTLRLWRIGRDVSDITIVAEQVVPDLKAKSKKAMKRDRLAWIEAARRSFMTAAEPMLSQRRVTRSPLLEAVSKIALTEVPGISQRVTILITDGLEYSSFADFECTDLAPNALAAKLHRERVLVPGTLKDTRVFLTFTDVTHISRNRCRSSIARLTSITESWRQVLREAGASDVSFSTGVAPLGDR